ncbi:MAG: hypothetical protein FWF05_06985 [Oscillospiraceae bacterium]|nr:hypothetical protein [Oscillospiraceae bacterium]
MSSVNPAKSNLIDYASKIKGPIESVDFERFLPSRECPFPQNRVRACMTLGPFILETDGAFETEYLYERSKTLDCDYLAGTGGEAAMVPFIGKKEKNDYYGADYLKWMSGHGRPPGNDYFFVTEQRNCVYYAAAYVNCKQESDAVICYENSGSLLYLNGELVDSQPYGRTKGLPTTGYQAAVTFREGMNLVIFKIRVGYIADGFDFGMTNCAVYPVAARSGELGFAFPDRTGAYLGTKDAPRQVFPLFFGAFGGDTESGTLRYTANGFSDEVTVPALKKGKCQLARLSVPVGEKSETVEIQASLNGEKASFFVETTPYNGFEGTEYMSSDFHFDTTYHQEQRTYALGAIHITSMMVEQLMKDPMFRATLSEVDYLHPYYAIYPEHRKALKEAFETGRAESDCFYNQPNDLTSSGEGFVRNLVYGQLYHRDVLGRISPVYAPGDVFGHCNQMSQICKKGGVSVLHWDKRIIGMDAAIHQFSPDGTSLINDRSLGRENSERLGIKHCWESSSMVDGMPAYPQDIDTSWQKETVTNVHHAVISDFDLAVMEDDREATERDGISKLDFSSRDITQHHSGVLLTRTDFKQANRLCENLLITAEKFSAIAAMYGAEYPEKALDKAWRQLLCAQHHDSVTGTNNEISFVDLMIEYREAVELAVTAVNSAAAFLASGVKLEKGDVPVFVFNPHPWERKENCEVALPAYADGGYALFDDKGREYGIQVTEKADGAVKAVFTPKAPAMGYAAYLLKKSEKVNGIELSDGNVIENEFYKITVDENFGGGIVSIYDKKAKREVVQNGVDGPANRIAVLREVADREETQHEIYTTGQKLFSSDFTAKVKCEKSPLYQKLIIDVKLDIIADARQEITLYKGVQRIDMKTSVEDYQFRDDLFTLTFPVNVKGGKTVYDDRYAPHIAGKSKNKLSFQTHQHVSYAHSRIIPANQWMELGKSVTVDLKNGRRAAGRFNIGMTALIRPDDKALKLAANDLLLALTKKAIPVTLFPDTEQRGHVKVIHFNEDLTNTDTRFVLSVEGVKNLYEGKLLADATQAQRDKFVDSLAKNDAAILYTIDKDNLFKKPIDVIFIKAASIEKLNEVIADIAEQLSQSAALDIAADAVCANAGEIDDYGVALINTGTISCSVEGDSMLNMMLFHTADFYGNMGKVTGGEQMIPEQKTHVFTYALYPHEGDFREANVYRKALEFNDPLFALSAVKAAENQILPLKKSFMKCDGDFVVTAFKAGGYPMAQMKADDGTMAERGFVLRGFEPNGVTGRTRVTLAFDVTGVQNVDLLEENAAPVRHSQNGFALTADAHAIETFKLDVSGVEQIGKAGQCVTKEPVEPTYVRTWEHDLGTMPMGYLAVAGVICKKLEKLDDVTYKFTLSLTNNHPDARITGEMKLLLPDGFTADRTVFPYDVEENGLLLETVTVKKPDADAKGVMRLHYEDDGQLFEDIYEFGYFNPDITLEIRGNQVAATVVNHTGAGLNGELSLATPFETWACDGFNTCANMDISPRTLKIEVADGERREYVFDVSDRPDGLLHAYWAAVKLMVNGRIHFAYDCVKGMPHNQSTRTYWDPEVRDKSGSLEMLLKMN